ncbi:bifunctional metallophosphatase/5'-nucleotidase [Nannocystis punicea]|uniref:Bifunctional metallophosphatase/5'-nucleotidase n=1 Tax=Nannocystis punicea TaxID=2995304 RepID=A0ABY7GTS7_9BACT|nr:bifunctional metallophosphatase/5'-nucleotidase [Nannocystis poenicansa]WAS90319.1 bifunctional metallophosphatase/5'-nucleotidase [Nannocystis poenicansa]
MQAANWMQTVRAPLWALALALGGCGSEGGDTATMPTTTDDTDPGTTDVAPTSSAGPTTDEPPTGTTVTDTTTTSETTGPDTTEGTTTTTTTSGTDTTDGVTSTDTTSATETAGETTVDTTDTGDTTTETTGEETFVKVQIVAFNDFHGNLEPPTGSGGKVKIDDNTSVDAGGAAYLAHHVAALREQNPNTIVVSAGDLIGASPLVSALFHDEPTIEAMNAIGLHYNAVGNHEFDDGATELLRMQDGGCHPVDGCGDDTPFPGAEFQFLAANVLKQQDPLETLFPSYALHTVEGVQIAFIGLTLQATGSIVSPAGIQGLTFADEVERVNALVPELQGMGVEAIVVLLHEGGLQSGLYNECPGISGPIVDIVEGLDDAVDVVVSGHTHQAYNCVIADKIVTSGASFGRVLTDIDLEISTKTGDVTMATAENVVVTRETADPMIAAFVAMYKQLAAPLANMQIGTITAKLAKNAQNPQVGLSTMGLVVADVMLDATQDPLLGGAELAFMNPGGVRADLAYAASGDEPVDGIVTYGEAFAVNPFGNNLVVLSLTGAQLDALLEQQFVEGEQPYILQMSAGFSYAYSASAPVGAKVDPASIELDGVVIDPAQEYRVATIGYLADGGDGFSVFTSGTDRVGGVTDMQALQDYFADHSPVSPPALDRVTVLP